MTHTPYCEYCEKENCGCNLMKQKTVTHTKTKYYKTVSAPDKITGLVHITDGKGGHADFSQGYIVKAVNSHEELLEACKAIKFDLENNGECYGTDEKRIEILSRAIAKAEGKQ